MIELNKKIDVGTTLEIEYANEKEKVLIISDFSGGYEWKYMILDLSTYEILQNFKSIEQLKEQLNIIKVVN